ncbi:MAG: hypothetical protein KGJ08_03070 [Gammaproteobacteria bacterium]|nr:hypothetical protein [Gammaproteobacteria bacterium]
MRCLLLTCILFSLTTSVFASNNINNLPALTQSQFQDLSTDVAAVISLKQLEGAAPEGITGFDVSLDMSTTNVAHASDWDLATNSTGITNVPMARARISKGLPFGFDIGGFYSYAPNSNIKVFGGELRYAIVEGSDVMPAIGVRAAFSQLAGVNQLSFNSKSLDFSISKGFGPFTPYAGVGRVWVNSNPDASTGLSDTSFGNSEMFVGLSMSFIAVHMALEANRIASNNTYSLKLGFGF